MLGWVLVTWPTLATTASAATLKGRELIAFTRSVPPRNLYHGRLSTLENFVLACVSTLKGKPIREDDFSHFIAEYCVESTKRGGSCPGKKVPFSSLPIELQLAFVDCPGANGFEQIGCLRNKIDSSSLLTHSGSAEGLCALSFPILKSASWLSDVEQNNVVKTMRGSDNFSDISLHSSEILEGKDKAVVDDDKKPSVKKVKKSGNRMNPSISLSPSPIYMPSLLPPPIRLPSLEPSTQPPESATPIPLLSVSSPTGSPLLEIVEVTAGENLRQKPTQSTTRDRINGFYLIALAGAGAFGTLCIALLVSRRVEWKRQVHYEQYLGTWDMPTGDASITSEPSQIYNISQEDEYTPDNHTHRLFLSSFDMFRFFQMIKRNKKEDPLEACRARTHFQWTAKAITSKVTGKDASEAKSTSQVQGTKIKTRGHQVSEENFLTNFAAFRCPDQTNNTSDFENSSSAEHSIENGYFLDIEVNSEQPASTISDSSEDEGQEGRSSFKFVMRTSDSNSLPFQPVDKTNPQSYSSQRTVDRETVHEDEAMEVLESGFSTNEKPWRTGLSLITMDCAASSNTRSDEGVEDGMSLLSPDVLRRFEEVDQRLSDGLKQLQEEDQKLSDEVDRLTASMSKIDAQRKDGHNEGYTSDDDLDTSPAEWDDHHHCDPSIEVQIMESYLRESGDAESSYGGDSAIDPESLRICDEAGRRGVEHVYPIEDGEEVEEFEFSDLRDRIRSKWNMGDTFRDWKEERLGISPPPGQKQQDYIVASSTSLLCPRLGSADEDDQGSV